MNGEGFPLRNVSDKSFVRKNVAPTPRTTTPSKRAAERVEFIIPPAVPTKKRVIRVIIAGNLPLQGISALVNTARFLSLLDAIILQPTTPTALQPRPILIHNACLPQAEHF